MELSKQHMDMLEKLGATFFSYKQAAIVLEVSDIELRTALKDTNSKEYRRYYKGWYTSEMELRESLLKSANRGSNPAINKVLEILSSNKIDNI